MQEDIIRNYFSMWLTRDFAHLKTYFSEDIVYRECYGAVYVGIEEILLWIEQMLQKQIVLRWDIKNISRVNETLFFIEWYFKAREEEIYAFDGISKIVFNKNKIQSIEEYESVHETFRPYN